jgi:hypothetical protein
MEYQSDKSPTGQVTSVYFFKFDRSKFWALSMMGIAPKTLQNTKGLVFSKVMGSGSGDGFSWWPDWSTYSLFLIWENDSNRIEFENSHATFRSYSQKSVGYQRFILSCREAHGLWSGSQPFVPNEKNESGPVTVLTRASIRTSQLWDFWKRVPGVNESIQLAKGKLFSKGVGEIPLIEQATISVWESEDAMKSFAYQQKAHQKVIKRTRQRKWYSEEMFVRFDLVEATYIAI